MLKALQEAQQMAPLDIEAVEHTQGDVYPMPWTNFTDYDLYRKLSQYQQGIVLYCVNKYGEEVFNRLLQEINSQQ